MDANSKEKLISVGVNVEQTLLLFMNNDAFYLKMLKKFPQDPTFAALVEHMGSADYELAFRDAHTLKGLTANLGLGELNKPAVELTECLRNEPRDIIRATEYFNEVKHAYHEAIAVINSI